MSSFKLMQTARCTSYLQAAFYVLFSGANNLSILVPPSQLQWTGQAYQASAQLSTAGSYEVAIRRGASHISGSPFQLAVLPGPTAANASLAWGTGLTAAVAGAPAGVMLQVTDSHASCSNDVPAACLLGCQGGNLPCTFSASKSLQQEVKRCQPNGTVLALCGAYFR